MLTGNCLAPRAALRDFCPALTAAIRAVFGNIDFGDEFHFERANLDWAHAHNASGMRAELGATLKELALVEDLDVFHKMKDSFLEYWG